MESCVHDESAGGLIGREESKKSSFQDFKWKMCCGERGEKWLFDRLATFELFSPISSNMATAAPEDGSQEASFQNISLGGKSAVVRAVNKVSWKGLIF